MNDSHPIINLERSHLQLRITRYRQQWPMLIVSHILLLFFIFVGIDRWRDGLVMNYITFHNRKKILEDYIYGPNNYRCIVCSLRYHPHYNKSENTFLKFDCDHLIHRQCLKSTNGHLAQDWQDNCQLCRRDEAFEQSAIQVRNRRRQREDEIIQIEYENVIRAVEKNGKYMFK